MSRHLKQLIYGGAYAAIMGIAIYVFYASFIKPEPSCWNGVQDRNEAGVDCGGVCAQICLPKDLRPITVQSILTFTPVKGRIGVLARVQNPNAALAARGFSYTMNLYDKNRTLITSRSGSSFLYAGEISYLTAFLDVPDAAAVARAEVLTAGPQWVEGGTFEKPQLAVQDRRTEVMESEIRVIGRILHRDTVELPSVTVIAMFYGGQVGRIVGFSETELNDVKPGESRPFAIVHPLLRGAEPVKTDVVIVARRP